MSINFTQVLQDSWRFFRNQQKIILQFVFILFVVQVLSALFSPPLIPAEAIPQDGSLPDFSKIDGVGFLSSFVITQLATTFIAAWGLMTIHHISKQNYNSLGQTFSATLPRFIGVVILDIIAVTPFILGSAEIISAAITQTAPSIISLMAIIFGIWFFVRLNLSAVHYLTSQEKIGQSLQTIWLKGRNKKGVLFIYTLLVYFVVPFLIFQLSRISGELIFSVIVSVFAALLNILMLVVTYRFYSLFMQEP